MGIKNKTATWAKDKIGDKIAPNGKPARENFVSWFGESKVVDENGEPLVVYHGTASDFPAFGNSRGNGFYFTGDPRAASAYAEYADSDQDSAGPNIVPAYLSLKNPLILDGQWQRDNMGADGEWEWEVLDHALYEAEAAGHDGAILRGFMDYSGYDNGMRTERIYDQYIAFRPEQIKSATANSGMFDTNSTRIDDTAPHGPDQSNKNLVADTQVNFELSSLDLSALEFDQVLERTHSDHQNSLSLKSR